MRANQLLSKAIIQFYPEKVHNRAICGTHRNFANPYHLSILSREGPQHSDSLSSLQFFANPYHLSSVNSTEFKIEFINELFTWADFYTLANDEVTIIKAIISTGLKLNTARCEIIMNDFSTFDSFCILRGFIRVPKDNMPLLEPPILQWQRWVEQFKPKLMNYKR